MHIQADLRVIVHTVTSMEISVIAAPDTKFNMPMFILTETKLFIYMLLVI